METKLLPKFSVGDMAWHLKDDKAAQEEVMGVFKGTDHLIRYYFFKEKEQPEKYGWVEEGKCYATREELIKTI